MRTLQEVRKEVVDGLDDKIVTVALQVILECFNIGPDEYGVQTSPRDRAEQFEAILTVVSDVVLHTWGLETGA